MFLIKYVIFLPALFSSSVRSAISTLLGEGCVTNEVEAFASTHVC